MSNKYSLNKEIRTVNQSIIEFNIVYFQQYSNSVAIAGRCYQGPINIGDQFHCLYKLVPEKVEERYGNHKRDEQLVNLCIDSIFAYGHFFTQLSPRMTAELRLSGKGINKRRFNLGNSIRIAR